MSLITLENIKKKYVEKTILDGVDFTVQKNERVALVGSNGSGKTTLLKIIMGLEKPDHGRVIIPKGSKVGYISQDFSEFYSDEADQRTAAQVTEIDQMESKMREMELLISGSSGNAEELGRLMTKYDALVDRFAAADGYNFEKTMLYVLHGLGLQKESLKVPLPSLSGGEKLRVMLARTIISKPDVLVLDEPTNHLDIKALEWLEAYLINFSGGVLFVSHDRYFLDKVATRVIELEGGTVTSMKSSYSEYLEQKKVMKEFNRKSQKDLEKQILYEKEIVQTLRHQRKISAFNSRLKKIEKMEEDLARVKRAGAEMHLGRIPSAVINLDHDIHISKEVATARGLGKHFGSRILFENANFLINGGDKVGIIGENGSGKTTLLNILSGKDSEYSGMASLGNWVRYGYISQDIVFKEDEVTVLEKLIEESRISETGELSERSALSYAANFKFYGEETRKKLSVLSGGEKSRLALALVLLHKPNCLVMDEPTNHLDIYTKEIMQNAFSDFRGTVIAISHDRYFLENCINRIIAIENQEIKVYEGNYSFYLRSSGIEIPVAQPDGKEEKYKKHMEKLRVEREKKASDERKRLIDELESKILELETYKEEFESGMNEDTTYDAYLEYQEKLGELEILYSKWEE
ncbi:MAG: ABC-F family ATP-binding cassette domain-containing protein, partial [Clostridia bacterium]|nr:ABC-F family ATP-binding cassette domain-containing protein [Clostridia bacterium]